MPVKLLSDADTRFALPIICPETGESVSAETLYNRCCEAMGHQVRDHIGDLILDNLNYPEFIEGEPKPYDDDALCGAVYEWANNVRTLIAEQVPARRKDRRRTMNKTRLKVNANGWIVTETTSPGRVHTAAATDLRFSIELRTNRGWQPHAEHTDHTVARREYSRRSRHFQWRLMASNLTGSVRLPDNWQGPQ